MVRSVTTQQPEPSNGEASFVDARANTEMVRPAGPDARVGREAFGILLLSFGLLGGLATLSALHWLAGLSAAFIGLCTSGIAVRRHAKARWQQDTGAIVAFAGYAGQTTILFVLLQPLGWLSVSLLGVAAGLWLSSSATEGA